MQFPYPTLMDDFSAGMDYIIANMPHNGSGGVSTDPDFDDLNRALVNFLKLKFSYATDVLNDVELYSYLPFAVNAYLVNDLEGVSPNLYPIVRQLLKNLFRVPPLQIEDLITNVALNFQKLNLSFHDQVQFFLVATGAANFEYFVNQINLGSNSPWYNFLDNNSAVNIANLPYWVSATMQAALYFSFKGDYVTNQNQPPKISGPAYVNALAASLGVAAGKVIFKSIPSI